MRPTVWLSVLGVSLIAVAARSQADAAGQNARSTAPRPLPSWTVESDWKETRDEAIQHALERAQIKVGDHLRTLSPRIEWTPPKEFLHKHLLRDVRKDTAFAEAAGGEIADFRTEGKTGREEVKDFPQAGRSMTRVVLHFEVSERDRQEIQQQERQHQTQLRKARAEQRQAIVVRLLAGIVALLAVAGAYLRLEDATKGYYTMLLRLAAVSFLAIAGAGILLFS